MVRHRHGRHGVVLLLHHLGIVRNALLQNGLLENLPGLAGLRAQVLLVYIVVRHVLLLVLLVLLLVVMVAVLLLLVLLVLLLILALLVLLMVLLLVPLFLLVVVVLLLVLLLALLVFVLPGCGDEEAPRRLTSRLEV